MDNSPLITKIDEIYRQAPEGQVYVCGACGKTSKDMAGKLALSRGWDESCMLNAILCWEDSLVRAEGSSRVTKADSVENNPRG